MDNEVMETEWFKEKLNEILLYADKISLAVVDIVDKLWEDEDIRRHFGGSKDRFSRYVSKTIIDVMESREDLPVC